MESTITIKFKAPCTWPAYAIRVSQSVIRGEAELTPESQAIRNLRGADYGLAPSIDPTGNDWWAALSDDRMSVTVRYRYTLDGDLRDALAKVLAWRLGGKVED